MIVFYYKHQRQRPFFLYWDTELLAYPADQQHFSNSFWYIIHTHSGAVGSYESPVWIYVVTLWREEQPLPITPRDGDDLARTLAVPAPFEFTSPYAEEGPGSQSHPAGAG